jgi:hypothetical protein
VSCGQQDSRASFCKSGKGTHLEINSNAPIISRYEITIGAPLETVWWVLTQIDSWSDWNPDIAKANLTGPITVGTLFHWETAGMAILRPLAKLQLRR